MGLQTQPLHCSRHMQRLILAGALQPTCLTLQEVAGVAEAVARDAAVGESASRSP